MEDRTIIIQKYNLPPLNRFFIQDDNARLDYYFDWSEYLGELTIQAYTITAPDGIMVESTELLDNGIITLWISGGEVGKVYRIACLIMTYYGHIDKRSMYIRVMNR